MELYRVVEGRGPRIVLVHGFTQTHVSWDPVARLLAPDLEVVRVDAPGHGGSADVAADLRTGARLLAEVGGQATYVGYSMGGRLALRTALDFPDVVRRLVLIGATAGIDDDVERAARRDADERLADTIEAEGVDRFLERWLAQPIFRGLTITPDDLASRLANTPEGLAGSLRLAGTATMDPPWWDELGSVTAPTTVVAGSRDQKFTELGRRIVEQIGARAEFRSIDDAGHAPHLERPLVVASLIRD